MFINLRAKLKFRDKKMLTELC